MFVYFLIAILAALASFAGSLFLQRGKKLAGFIFYAIALFVFCHAAGMRSITVGTDTSVYGYPVYNQAKCMPFGLFLEQYHRFGILFNLLAWPTAHFTRSYYWTFFMIELVAVCPVIIACQASLKRFSAIGVLVFGIAFFPMSLNIMRQFMAMGFLLLVYLASIKKKLIPSLLLCVLSAGFHTSG